MSALLDEIIAARKARAIEYEEYLQRIAALAKRVEVGVAEDTPPQLRKSPGLRALYNNLKAPRGTPVQPNRVSETRAVYMSTGDPILDQALKIDEIVRVVRPDGWRGIQARELVIKAALYDVLRDSDEVERIFLIIKAQREY